MTRWPVRLWVLATLVFLISTCSRGDRAGAARVLRGLEEARTAPIDQKGAPADALSRVPCSDAVVCSARDRCSAVYRHFAEGMAAEAHVKAEIEAIEREPTDAEARKAALAKELDGAEAEVDQARAGLAECERAASVLRRTYGI